MSNTPVTSQTWLQNFRPSVNGIKVRWPDLNLSLMAGECIDLMLEFEYSYLIGDPESDLQLCCEPAAESLGLVCDPPFGQLVEMKEGLISLTWHICASQTASGSFELHFAMPKYQGMPLSPKILGSVVNYEKELEVSFDSFSLSLGNIAFPCHGARHTLTVRPKSSSQFLNTNVHLSIEGDNPGVVFDPPLSTLRLLTPTGVSWALDCLSTSRNAEFDLQVISEMPGIPPMLMCVSLAHNKVIAEHWEEPADGLPAYPRKLVGIRAKSAFSGVLASAVKVDLIKGGDKYSVPTDVRGEYRVNVDASSYVSMSIFNKYDGSTV